MDELRKRLERIEKELSSLRGKEYEQPFGSMRRARISRKCDMLAIEKMKILTKIYENE